MSERTCLSPVPGECGLPPVEVSVTCDVFADDVTTVSVSDGDRLSINSNIPVTVRILHGVCDTAENEPLISEESRESERPGSTENENITGNQDNHVTKVTTPREDSPAGLSKIASNSIEEIVPDVIAVKSLDGVKSGLSVSISGDRVISSTPEQWNGHVLDDQQVTMGDSVIRKPRDEDSSSSHCARSNVDNAENSDLIQYETMLPALNDSYQSVTKANEDGPEMANSAVGVVSINTLSPAVQLSGTGVIGEALNQDESSPQPPTVVISPVKNHFPNDASLSADDDNVTTAIEDVLEVSVFDNDNVIVSQEDLPFDMGQNKSVISGDETLAKSSKNICNLNSTDDTDNPEQSRSESPNTDSARRLPDDFEYSPSEFGNPSSILNLVVAPFGKYEPPDEELLEDSDVEDLLPDARSRATTYFKHRRPKLPSYPNRAKMPTVRGRHGLHLSPGRKLAAALHIRKRSNILRENFHLAEIARAIQTRQRVSDANRQWKTYEEDNVETRVSGRVRFAQTARLRVVLEERFTLINRIIKCLLNSPCISWKSVGNDNVPTVMEEYEFSMA